MAQERVGETINGENILFSAETSYRDCTFENCTYQVDGTGFHSQDCRFGPGNWEFLDAASNTIDLVGAFWSTPGSEPLLQLLFTRMTGDEEIARKIVALKPA